MSGTRKRSAFRGFHRLREAGAGGSNPPTPTTVSDRERSETPLDAGDLTDFELRVLRAVCGHPVTVAVNSETASAALSELQDRGFVYVHVYVHVVAQRSSIRHAYRPTLLGLVRTAPWSPEAEGER